MLEVYKPESVAKVNYLSDYPLATKEGTANYQNQVLSKLMSESAAERIIRNCLICKNRLNGT